MTEDQWRAFLSEGTRTGKLAVTRKDGSPHVTPIWFLLDGPDFVFNTGETSMKGRILRRDPRVCLCVDLMEPPYSFVMVEGEAEISTDPEEMLTWATKLGVRYMGPERGAEFGRRNAEAGELLVRVRMTKVVAFDDISG
ncbi:MAG: PPOX class F420-dependent oxidoreductase [Catenulispora sp.]|nr:PPOX class F420-dependent oxidoreductase [Catenulispora sp.]